MTQSDISKELSKIIDNGSEKLHNAIMGAIQADWHNNSEMVVAMHHVVDAKTEMIDNLIELYGKI